MHSFNGYSQHLFLIPLHQTKNKVHQLTHYVVVHLSLSSLPDNMAPCILCTMRGDQSPLHVSVKSHYLMKEKEISKEIILPVHGSPSKHK